jgi:hypothetical protein
MFGAGGALRSRTPCIQYAATRKSNTWHIQFKPYAVYLPLIKHQHHKCIHIRQSFTAAGWATDTKR